MCLVVLLIPKTPPPTPITETVKGCLLNRSNDCLRVLVTLSYSPLFQIGPMKIRGHKVLGLFGLHRPL
jgi:hypothetical protein